jgi:hypothetical protein
MVYIEATRDGTGSYREHDFGRWNSLIRLLQGALHISRDRTSNKESIGMAGRGNELYTKTSDVKNDGIQDIDVGFTRIAPSGADLSQLQRPSKESLQLLVQSRR